MKGFLILSALLSVALARPSLLQVSPLSSLQARASASASASSLPQQLTLLRLLPNTPLDPDSQVLETLETSQQERADQQTSSQRAQANLRDSARNVLTLSPLLSASSSASASSSLSDARVLDLEASLSRAAQAAAQAAAQRDEQRRLAGQSAQSAQAQSQQQVSGGAGSLLSATRLAQSLASLSPTGASSSSSVQVLESPELTAARAALQRQQQTVLLTRETNLPLLVGSDGQLVAGQLLVL